MQQGCSFLYMPETSGGLMWLPVARQKGSGATWKMKRGIYVQLTYEKSTGG